jgi:hypothetical protein
MSNFEVREYLRKPFTVSAVEVTLDNIQAVAQWCNGTVEMVPTRLLGTKTDLPAIKIKGNGDFRDKTFTASLGCFIAEMNGSFRVYTPQNMGNMFDLVEKQETEEDYVAVDPVIETLAEDQMRSVL